MFKRLIKKLYFRAYPYAADIGKDDVRDMSDEIRDLKENLRAYERQEITRTKLKKLNFEAIEFLPLEMIESISDQANFEDRLREMFARKFEKELAKRFVIKEDKALNGRTIKAYRAYITFYEEE